MQIFKIIYESRIKTKNQILKLIRKNIFIFPDTVIYESRQPMRSNGCGSI